MIDLLNIDTKFNKILAKVIPRKILNKYYSYNYIRELWILKDHLEALKFAKTLKTLDTDSQYELTYRLYPPHHLKLEKDYLDVGFTKKQLNNKLMFQVNKTLKPITVCTYTPGKIDVDCEDNCKDCD